MGAPPVAIRPRHRSFGGAVFPIFLVLPFVILIIIPISGDAINGMVKPNDGCKILSLIDGDTAKLVCPEKGWMTARFLGFDAPEFGSAGCFSERVKAFAATFYLRWELWTASRISAVPYGKDRYGRYLTELNLDGENAGEIMVTAGLARDYKGGQRMSWCD
ncbi:thermonuclease family protein [Shimia sp. SK013]|uniref:thermonuclease family protein n=1 Tax=Shimia sp. SK013 TaxID=1389006 RepID=UPI0006B43668